MDLRIWSDVYVWINENRVKDCTKKAGVFLESRSDSVHKNGHVVLTVLSTSRTLKVISLK